MNVDQMKKWHSDLQVGEIAVVYSHVYLQLTYG